MTTQSVEARPGIAGMCWYEIRRSGNPKPSLYSVTQQGTYAPDDGVNRWMGSVAMDRQGNMMLGYNVVNGLDVYPGIRYTMAHQMVESEGGDRYRGGIGLSKCAANVTDLETQMQNVMGIVAW